MARLPQLGGDAGTWGQVLNDFLVQAHNTDGTIKPGAVSTAAVTDGTITEAKLAPAVVTKLNTVAGGGSAVTSVNGQTGAVTVDQAAVGLDNVDNTADAAKPISTATQTALNAKANASTNVATSGSLTGGGPLSGSLSLSLAGDSAAPGNNMYYGTNGMGTKGFYAVPTGGGGGSVTSVNGQTGAVTLSKTDVGLASVDNTADTAKNVLSATKLTTARTINGVSFDGSANITLPADSTKVSTSTTVTGTNSLAGGGALSGNVSLSLLNDVASPGNSMYYGTSAAGTKGYFALPSGGGTPAATTTTTGTVTLAGDLAGTATAPTVAKVNGVAVTGTPAAGQVLKATSATAASWQADATGTGGAGGLNFSFRSISANTTAANNECLIVTSTPTGITITLPAPVANGLVRVKRLAPNGNSIQVAAPSGSVIDDLTVGTDTLNNQYESRDYWSNGTNWYR